MLILLDAFLRWLRGPAPKKTKPPEYYRGGRPKRTATRMAAYIEQQRRLGEPVNLLYWLSPQEEGITAPSDFRNRIIGAVSGILGRRLVPHG